MALTRSGAAVGDLLAITLSASPGKPFTGLGTRWAHELVPYLSAEERSIIAGLVKADAKSDLGLPVAVMRDIVQARLATAAMDTSDGVLGCAQLIGENSRVGVEIFPGAISALVDPEVTCLAEALGIAPFFFALNAGHDWEVVMTVPEERRAELRAVASPDSAAPPRVAVIGRIVPRASWSDVGVLVAGGSESGTVLPYFTDEKFVPKPYELRAREWLDFARDSSRLLARSAVG
jgi:thiamine monophosphate kinase